MYKLLSFISITGLLLVASCDDIIEPKLSDRRVTIIAPADSSVQSNTTITFWWDEVKGATKYNIQIVSPSFTNIQYLVADSNVIGDKFTVALQPGLYQWRIKAVNNSTETPFSTYSFSIDSSLNLSGQSIQLQSPANNTYTNQLTQTFVWSPMYYADDYRFEILSSFGNTVYTNAALATTNVSYTFSTDGTYTWRVRAQNSTSVSAYSSALLIIDQTPPAVPVITSPANNAIVSAPFTLSWSQATDNGSPIYDSLYIYANAGQDTLIKALRPATTTYTDSFGTGDYFWKLRAIDSVGNYSNYTSLYKFIIQ